MYESEHTIEPSFTVDDLNDMLTKHQDIVHSYEFIFNSIDAKKLVEHFREIASSHQEDINMLKELITDLGGDPASSDQAAVTKNMRLMLSTKMSSALDLIDKMQIEESALFDKYIKNLNGLTKVASLESVLKINAEHAHQRVEKLAEFVDLEATA